MKADELEEEISIELDFIESTVQELLSLERFGGQRAFCSGKDCGRCLYGSVLQWYRKHSETNYSF